MTPAWAERGMVALIAPLGVHEGRFAWGILGLVLLALVLVVVALVIGSLALRRSRRALAKVAALASGGVQPEPAPRAERAEEAEAESAPAEPAPEQAAPVPKPEPELRPIPTEVEGPEEPAAEPEIPEPAPALELTAPDAPPGGTAEEVVCECGHGKEDHFRVTATKWMCLADVVPACRCRQFAPPRNGTAGLLRLLQHPDELVRAAAAADLRGRPEATGALLDALDDDSARVRLEAVKALEDVPPDPAVRRALIDVIAQDLVPTVRQEGVRVLATFLSRAGAPGAA